MKTDAARRHKFTASLENTFDVDYVTEKRYQAFVAGSVPIVFKGLNSDDFLPGPNSAIVVEEFENSGHKIAEYLAKANVDPAEYAKWHEWKKTGIKREFVKILFHKWDFLACRLCEYFSQKPHPTKPPSVKV